MPYARTQTHTHTHTHTFQHRLRVHAYICNNVHTQNGLARTVYIHRIFDDFSAKNTVYTPYIYMVLAKPMYSYIRCTNGIDHVHVCMTMSMYVWPCCATRAGQKYTFIAIYGVHTVFTMSMYVWPCCTTRVGHKHTCIARVGQNRIYTPYMTVYLMISLPKIPYIHRIYMVLANLIYIYIQCAYGILSREITMHTVQLHGSGQPYVPPMLTCH